MTICICGPAGCDDDGYLNDHNLLCPLCSQMDCYEPCPAPKPDDVGYEQEEVDHDSDS